jgi:DNA processing protein
MDRASLLDAVALAAVPGVGPRGWHDAVREHASATRALGELRRPRGVISEARVHAEAQLARADELGARCLVATDEAYPRSLVELQLADAPGLAWHPPVLFALGDLTMLDRVAVALVGTRQPSADGRSAARSLARSICQAGGVVVSGLARGIDAEAHSAALDADGATIAVIGTGLDVTYPADHRTLQQRIARDALLVTESWFGARAHAGSFPLRNRIIAALARATVVVEAPVQSGALITARVAEQLGRATAAVPGAFGLANALGSNRLLAAGAHVIADADDLVTLVGLTPAPTVVSAPDLSPAEHAVWDQVGAQAVPIDTLVERSGWAADACLAAITTLELRGLVRSLAHGAIIRA